MNENENERAVRLTLPDSHYAALRVLAAKAGKSMAKYVREIVAKAIQNREKGDAR